MLAGYTVGLYSCETARHVKSSLETLTVLRFVFLLQYIGNSIHMSVRTLGRHCRSDLLVDTWTPFQVYSIAILGCIARIDVLLLGTWA
jgi:hypothetical protein